MTNKAISLSSTSFEHDETCDVLVWEAVPQLVPSPLTDCTKLRIKLKEEEKEEEKEKA